MDTHISLWNPYYIIMVSLGTVAKFAIPAAVIVGIFLFRDKIATAAGTVGKGLGEALGGGLGAGFGGLVGSLPSAFVSGGTSAFVQSTGGGGTSPSGKPTVSPFGFEGPWDFLLKTQTAYGETAPSNGHSGSGNIGGSGNNQTDKTVNQYNRDFSDVVYQAPIVKARIAATQKLVQSQPKTIGHAERARTAIQATGFSPLGEFKKVLPTLREQGFTTAQAYKIWSGSR